MDNCNYDMDDSNLEKELTDDLPDTADLDSLGDMAEPDYSECLNEMNTIEDFIETGEPIEPMTMEELLKTQEELDFDQNWLQQVESEADEYSNVMDTEEDFTDMDEQVEPMTEEELLKTQSELETDDSGIEDNQSDLQLELGVKEVDTDSKGIDITEELKSIVDLNLETLHTPSNYGEWFKDVNGDMIWKPDDDYIPGNKIYNPEGLKFSELKDKYGFEGIRFHNNEPDFSGFA